MTRHSFIQMSKLSNVKGRISYITSHARQENLYAIYRTADNAFWSDLAKECQQEFTLYNSMVFGIHNYYRYATMIATDCEQIHRAVSTVMKNRLYGYVLRTHAATSLSRLEPQHRGEQLSLELRLSQGIDPVLDAPRLIEEGVRAELVHITVEIGEDLLHGNGVA